MVRFAIDERSLNLDDLNTAEAKQRLTSFLNLLHDVESGGHPLCYDPDLFTNTMRNGLTFWELFGESSDLGLSFEDREIADAIFINMHRWEELGEPQPSTFDVQVDTGATEVTGSIAWAHAQGSQGLAAAGCISAPGGRLSGSRRVSANSVEYQVWFATSEFDVEKYFRSLLEQHAHKPDHFAQFARDAFRNLDFVENCFNGIGKMAGSCRDLAPTLVKHLEVLSDYGAMIFSGQWQSAPAEFGAYGIDISDENGNTKGDGKAAKERVREVDGKNVHFWWHCKLERHQNRIHIYPDRVRQKKNIVIGIFCNHLK